MVDVLHKAAAVVGLRLVPAEWISLRPSQIRAFLRSYETSGRQGSAAILDWRRVLYTLAAIPAPTVEQLQQAVAAVKAGGGTALQTVALETASKVRLWFEAGPPPETLESEDGVTLVKGHQIPLLKEAVLSMFTAPSANGSNGPVVNFEHLVLYACADKQAEGVSRAVRVLGKPDVSVDETILLSILALGSLSCFDPDRFRTSDSEFVQAVLAGAKEGKGPK